MLRVAAPLGGSIGIQAVLRYCVPSRRSHCLRARRSRETQEPAISVAAILGSLGFGVCSSQTLWVQMTGPAGQFLD